MAAGGVEPPTCDSRVVCSVCLEPYKGRQPKLLPCFHTFCLPCLQQLSDRASQATSETQAAEDSEPQHASALTITCPACRKVVPVPEGGVAFFQKSSLQKSILGKSMLRSVFDTDFGKTNFYVDVDGSQQASGVFDSITSSVHDERRKARQKMTDQIRVLEAVVGKLEGNEKELTRQKTAVDQELNNRYAMLLGLVADARDCFVRSARETAEVQQDELQKELTAAKKTLAEQKSLFRNTTSSTAQLQAALLPDADVETFQKIIQDHLPAFFTCVHDDDTTELVNCLKRFFGSVGCSGKQELAQADLDKGTRRPAEPTLSENAENASASTQDVDLKAKVEYLSSMVETLVAEQTAVRDRNTTLSRDSVSVQRELSALSREFASHRDKNALLCQDVAMLQADLAKVQADRAHGFVKIASPQTGSALFQADHTVSDRLAAVERKMFTLERTVDDCSTSLRQLRDDINTASRCVAFHATLNETVITRSMRNLVYKAVLLNAGGGYDPQKGIFTAPIKGTYMFMAAAMPAEKGKPAKLALMHGKGSETTELAYVHSNNISTSSTCHSLVFLSKGERVWMETYPSPSSFEEAGGGHENAFSGILVHG